MPLPRSILSPREPEDADLSVIAGELPSDLAGEIFLSGPYLKHRGKHAFYGDGVLYRLSLAAGTHGAPAGRHAFRHAVLRTPSQRLRARHPEQFIDGPYGANSAFGYFSSANTAQVPMGDRLLVTWDGGRPVEVDPLSLEFLAEVGRYDSWGAIGDNPALPSIMTPAHPVYDPERHCLWTADTHPLTHAVALVRYDGQGTCVQRWPLSGAKITQSVHTISQTQNYIIIAENGFVVDHNEMFGAERKVTTSRRAPLYVIRKDLVEKTPPSQPLEVKCFHVAPEHMHYYADYDDRHGIRVFFEHSTDSDIAMALRPGDLDLYGSPIEPALVGMYGLALSPPSVSLVCFDPQTGRSQQLAHYSDPTRLWNTQTSAMDWSHRGLLKPTLHHVMYNGFRGEAVSQRQLKLYESRIDRGLWPDREQPACLASFDWNDELRPKGIFQFERDAWVTTPTFVPRQLDPSQDAYTGKMPGGHDGYLVVPVLRDAGLRVDVFDAAKVREGPIASLAAPGHHLGFIIHGCFMPEAKRASGNIERLRFRDELSDSRFRLLAPDLARSVREVAEEIESDARGRA